MLVHSISLHEAIHCFKARGRSHRPFRPLDGRGFVYAANPWQCDNPDAEMRLMLRSLREPVLIFFFVLLARGLMEGEWEAGTGLVFFHAMMFFVLRILSLRRVCCITFLFEWPVSPLVAFSH